MLRTVQPFACASSKLFELADVRLAVVTGAHRAELPLDRAPALLPFRRCGRGGRNAPERIGPPTHVTTTSTRIVFTYSFIEQAAHRHSLLLVSFQGILKVDHDLLADLDESAPRIVEVGNDRDDGGEQDGQDDH